MRKLIALLCFAFLNNYAIAQNNIVNINFEVDGKSTANKNAIAKFIYNKDTINASIEEGKLTIPATVIKQKATVNFI